MNDIEPYETIYSFMEMVISNYGVLGIAIAMFAESAGVPFASAVIVLAAGPMILQGKVSFWAVLIASTLGITFGSIFSYIIGLMGQKVGRVIKGSYKQRFNSIDDLSDYQSSSGRFKMLWNRYGKFSIFMAQLWGVTRTFVSYPAGALNINFFVFVIYTFFGGALFSLLAIGVSIVLTGTLSATIKIIISVIENVPWLLLILPLLVIVYIYIFKPGIIFKIKNSVTNIFSRRGFSGRTNDRKR